MVCQIAGNPAACHRPIRFDLVRPGWHGSRKQHRTGISILVRFRTPREEMNSVAPAILRDFRFGARTLLKAPAFTAAVVITMALGIGATVSMFTVVDSIVLRPLPFPESARVVMLCETSARVPDRCIASPPNVSDWAHASRTLESAGVARSESFVAQTGDGFSGVAGGIATPGFFRVLRVQPLLGRLFEDRDLDRGSNRVTLVSHAFWRRALHDDPAAVGKTVTLDGRAFTVIGVLPANAYIPELGVVDVWKPLTASIDNVDNRNWRGFTAIGRLAPGTSLATARVELDTIRAQLAAAYPEANADWGIRIVDIRDQTVAPTRTTLWIFFGATGFVLLIACANVAGLLLVRSTRRAPEFAVRAFLGAGRGRIVRQLLTESVVMSLAGGSLGLLLALWATRAFVVLAPPSIPRLDEVTIDARVALFAVALSVMTAVLFGLAPARMASRVDIATTLKGQRHGARRESRLRSGLVIVEMALALILLVGAGLLTRTFGRLLQWEPGFTRAGLVTSWMLAPSGTYRTTRAAVGMLERARDEVATLPGVQSVALASAGPLFGGVETDALSVEGGGAVDPSASASPVNWFDVSPEYFAALGIAIVKGRPFDSGDAAGSAQVAVINEALARRFFAGQDPLGRRVTVMTHTSEIVGIVADIQPYRPDRATPPEIYWPIRQYPRLAAYLVMRVAPGVQGIEKMVRARVAAVDAGVQLTPVVSFDERFSRTLVAPRFNMLILGVFAFVAIALAAVGVFGVIAYSIASRTREIGVRVALGATPQRIVADVVRRGMTLAGAGMVIGLAGALALGRLFATLLYGLAPTDWLTLSITVLGFGAVAFGASYLPARRAAAVDPLTALRHE
jgi:putative ABC transport system permease protein